MVSHVAFTETSVYNRGIPISVKNKNLAYRVLRDKNMLLNVLARPSLVKKIFFFRDSISNLESSLGYKFGVSVNSGPHCSIDKILLLFDYMKLLFHFSGLFSACLISILHSDRV